MAVAAVDPGTDAPETTLDLRLNGLRSGQNGSAYIRTPDGQDRNYYGSEEVMPGVVLTGVFPGYVLIQVNGQTQRLTMEDTRLTRQASPGGPNENSTAGQAGLQTLRAPDAESLLSQVKIVPALDRGPGGGTQRVGVRISPRSSGVDLSTYGLRDGDIIVRFAGQSLTSGLPDIAALRRATSPGRPVSVDILRDGQPMTITIGSAS